MEMAKPSLLDAERRGQGIKVTIDLDSYKNLGQVFKFKMDSSFTISVLQILLIWWRWINANRTILKFVEIYRIRRKIRSNIICKRNIVEYLHTCNIPYIFASATWNFPICLIPTFPLNFYSCTQCITTALDPSCQGYTQIQGKKINFPL